MELDHNLPSKELGALQIELTTHDRTLLIIERSYNLSTISEKFSDFSDSKFYSGKF